MDKILKKYASGQSVCIATLAHAEKLAPLLRKEDITEAKAFGYPSSKEALTEAIAADDLSITCLDAEGVPFAMLGVGRAGDTSYIWLLGSEGIKDNWYTFAKGSKEWIQPLIKKYGKVTNFVLESYETSVRWLNWLGADFTKRVEIGGEMFLEFVIDAEEEEEEEETILDVFKSPMPLEEFRAKIAVFADEIKNSEHGTDDRAVIDTINPLEHTFGDGMYIRKIVMPANQIIISKIHKQKHPYFIMSGDVSVITENGLQRIKAPYNGITEAGTQRALYTHSETVWLTVHRTDETDTDKLLDILTVDNFNELIEGDN
jgi:hypothetical protein